MRPICLLISFALVWASGCAKLTSKSSPSEYQTIVQSGRHDEAKARKKHAHAIKAVCHGKYLVAEQLLRDALLADVSFGPAHNTLGKLYFDQQKYYLAAWEFEYAQRLMPERGEPLNNLGLVYESTGQLDKAIDFYNQAYNLAPDNAFYLGNLIRARIRSGLHPMLMQEMIQRLIFIDDRPDWDDWARSLLELRQPPGDALFLDDGSQPYEQWMIPYQNFDDLPGPGSAPIEPPLDPDSQGPEFFHSPLAD